MVTPETPKYFVDRVVPITQEPGIYKQDYVEGTLRDKLLLPGVPLLPETHPGASYRRQQQSVREAE